MQPHDNCWHCGNPSAESLFCRYCNTLQRPKPDYFRFMGLEPRLSVDAADLQKRFYSLSRLLHPDHYNHASPTEKQYSLEATAILNDAYRVLRDPVSRAEYILKEEGFDIGEQKTKDVPPELLEEVFELNMALEELRGGDAGVRPHLEEARKRFLALRRELDDSLAQRYAAYDKARERERLAEIRGLLNRRRYIQNLVNVVERELAP
jgi:molecular chaperone HscB